MQGFDFYEIVGILVPGSMLLLGIWIIFPAIRLSPQDASLALGEFGIFTILSYGVGHLVQAVGNGLELVWWRLWRGLPSDWVRSESHPLLFDTQRKALLDQIPSKLGIAMPAIDTLSSAAWFGITRQIYAAVAAASRSQRIDIFNATYALSRGIAASLVSLAVLALLQFRWTGLKPSALLFAGVVIAIYRMHLFGKHYARELFVQFLQLPMPAADRGQNK